MRKPSSSRPQDWRFLLAVFSTGSFLELTAWGHMLAFSPLFLQNELGIPSSEVPMWAGLLASSSLAVALPLSPFWGVLADRYSRKAVIARAQLAEAVAYALAAVCGDVWQFLAIRLLLGFSFGNVAVVMATQSMVTPDRRVGIAIGIIQTASTLATSVGPLIGSLVINTLGLRAMWAMDSVMALSAVLLITLTFKEPDVHDRTTPVGEKLKLVFGQVTRVPPIRWNFLAWFLVFAGAGAMDPFLPVLIDRLWQGPDSATGIGALLAVYGLLTALATPVVGRLADRFGAAPLFLLAAPMLAMVAGGFALAGSLPVLALLVIARAGPQSGTAVVLYSHLAAHVPARHRASVMSLTPMPRNAAWLVAPALASAASIFGLSGVFWFAAAMYAGAAAVAVLLLRASHSAA